MVLGWLKRLFGGRSIPPFEMPDDAELETTDSGLKYKVLEPADGLKPGLSHTVSVHYTGWLTDGRVFDSSVGRGRPVSFPLGRVIQGWQEGLQLMSEGSKYVFVIPPDLGYGARGVPPAIPPNATLVFQVELLQIGG